jgi:hypothetical protein
VVVVVVRPELRQSNIFRSLLRLLVTANVVAIAQNFVTLIIEAILSSETPFFTGSTQRNNPEDGIFQYGYSLTI